MNPEEQRITQLCEFVRGWNIGQRWATMYFQEESGRAPRVSFEEAGIEAL